MIKKIAFNLRLFFIPCQENDYKPKFLEGKFLIFCIIVLIIAKLVAISFFVYFPQTTFFADLTAALTKAALIDMTNQERQTSGVSPLKVNQKLEEAAYLKAQDMIEKDYFSHQSPTGKTPWDWLKLVNYNYKYAGENLAIGFLDSEEVITAWNQSPSHRDNILSSNYQEIGIAVVKGNFQGSETTLVVQFFGSSLKKEPPPLELTKETKPKETELEKPISLEKEIIPPKEEILPEISQEEKEREISLEQKEPQVAASQKEKKEEAPAFRLFRFMVADYPYFLQKIIFYFLVLIIISLILNIFIRIDIQDKFLIFKTIILIVLLVLLIIFDKELIIQFIPHNLLI